MTDTHDEVKPAGTGDESAGTENSESAEPEAKDTRSPTEIEADLDRTRARLSATLDELSDRLTPRELARSGGQAVKAQFVVPETGQLRRAPVAALIGGFSLAAGAVFALWRLRRRSS